MDYQQFFADNLAKLRHSGDYRVFADLEREAGAYPKAVFHDGGRQAPVTVWCSSPADIVGTVSWRSICRRPAVTSAGQAR